MKKLINYEKLETCVLEYEKYKKKMQLDLDEEKLLLDVLQDRRENKIQKLKTDTYLGGVGPGLFRSLLGKTKKANEEEEF